MSIKFSSKRAPYSGIDIPYSNSGQYIGMRGRVVYTGATGYTGTVTVQTNEDSTLKTGIKVISRFYDNKNGTYTDLATGLMWVYDQANVLAAKDTWYACLTAVDALTYAGWSDWRMPTILELLTLVDWGKTSSATMYAAIAGRDPGGTYWSSTTCGVSNDKANYVNYYTAGGVNQSLKTTASYGWCKAVRGPIL